MYQILTYVKVRTVIYVWSMFTKPGAIVSFSCFSVYAMENPVFGLIVHGCSWGRRVVGDTLKLQKIKVGVLPQVVPMHVFPSPV